MSNKDEKQELIWIASIDIGSKNFAFYVEQIDTKILSNIKNIPSSERYNSDGTPTPNMNIILKTIFKNGETILHENVDLTLAKKLEELPRTIGKHPEDGLTISAGIGPYGAYLLHNKNPVNNLKCQI